MMTVADKIILSAASAVVLSVYIRTLSHSIAGGDSGEIVAEGCKLGTAHPPGYPLITLIIYGITFLRDTSLQLSPNITVASCVNAFCAICTTIAAILIGHMIDVGKPSYFRKESMYGAQILSMGMFAFSPLVWQYAITAEVFPLNTMFSSLILWLTLLFAKTRELKFIYWGAFVCGLALCNQHTIILYVIPLVLWILYVCRKVIYHHPSSLVYLSASFLSGLSFYLYLPIAAIYNEIPGSWGHVSDISGLFHHILRRDYGTFQLFSGASGRKVEGFWERTNAYLSDITHTQGVYSLIPLLSLIGGLAWLIINLLQSIQSVSSLPQDSVVASPAGTGTTKSSRKKKLTSTPVPTIIKSPSDAKVISKKDSKSRSVEEIQSMKLEDLISETECSFIPGTFLFTQLFYFGIFHSLANLPLNDKLLYGIHQRFWMQPNVMMFLWMGFGYSTAFFVLDKVLLFIIWLISNMPKKGSPYSSLISTLVHSASVPVAVWIVYMQCSTWFERMDHSRVYHFNNYAAAVLDALPRNAVLLVNYDQQWTSVRYMQQCEGFRTDVTSINLSMMTYQWFQTKRYLYPNITFPGTFHTYPTSPSLESHHAFTLLNFLDANYEDRDVFLGGKYSYNDPALDQQYDSVPIGLVTHLIPHRFAPNGTLYLRSTVESWRTLLGHLPALPDVRKFPEETWEWTIGRDFKDRVIDTAAYMLIAAIKVAHVDAKPLIHAVYWLETAYLLDGENCGSALLKNAGLGHVHLIQNKVLKTFKPPKLDLFHSLEGIQWPASSAAEWKIWSGNRFKFFWGEFLNRPDAVKDPQFGTIKPFLFDPEFPTVNKNCTYICDHGACSFENCGNSPSCPGGACKFYRSDSPRCSGGACVFIECRNASCTGGSCSFRSPLDTLRLGYCTGGNCHLEGKAHPDFANYVSY